MEMEERNQDEKECLQRKKIKRETDVKIKRKTPSGTNNRKGGKGWRRYRNEYKGDGDERRGTREI